MAQVTKTIINNMGTKKSKNKQYSKKMKDVREPAQNIETYLEGTRTSGSWKVLGGLKQN